MRALSIFNLARYHHKRRFTYWINNLSRVRGLKLFR